MSGLWAPALLVVVLGGAYAVALARRPAGRRAWGAARPLAWAAGVLVAAAAVSPPLVALAAQDHRAHMAQHLLLAMYAPLGLVVGAPVTLLLGSLRPPAARRLVRVLRSGPVRVLTHPAVAAVPATGGLLVLYGTPLYRVTLSSPPVHALVLAHLLLAGWLWTWSVAAPDPVPGRPGTRVRLAVLVVAAGVHAWLAKHLYAGATRAGSDGAAAGPADHAHHAGAGTAAAVEPLTGHGAEALREAARLMYYGGDVAELLLVVLVLLAWWRRPDRRAGAPQASSGRRPTILSTRFRGPTMLTAWYSRLSGGDPATAARYSS